MLSVRPGPKEECLSLLLWASISTASGLDKEKITGALDELEWQRWLAAERRGYSFVARIVRDLVARDMLTEGQRQRQRLREAGAS